MWIKVLTYDLTGSNTPSRSAQLALPLRGTFLTNTSLVSFEFQESCVVHIRDDDV